MSSLSTTDPSLEEVVIQKDEVKDDSTRAKMSEYWNEFASATTVEGMMLDDGASLIDRSDQNEVLSFIGDIENKNVLELAAGIGRLTSRIMTDKKPKHLLTTDFMESYVETNRVTNGHFPNIEFACSDVVTQIFPKSTYEHIFSNWLFMYLSDDETSQVFKKIYDSLIVGGTFYVRESCFRQSGDKARSFNPTNYRSDLLYNELMAGACGGTLSDNGSEIVGGGMVIEKVGRSETYVRVKDNENQKMWLFRKVR